MVQLKNVKRWVKNACAVTKFRQLRYFYFFFIVIRYFNMYLRKDKISKAAFLEKTPQQPSLNIIWFRVSPKWKYYFMSDTYLKPSQTTKMKLHAKVVNASIDVFRTVFSIQNVFRRSKMALFTKIMNGWKPLTFSAKGSIWDILLGPGNASGFTFFNYFRQKLHLRSIRGQICLCMFLVPQIWRWDE